MAADKASDSSNFEEDFRKMEQLEIESRSEQNALISLIEVYEQLIGRIDLDQNTHLYATLQQKLGSACCTLFMGDRTANLLRGITCFHEALRFWTPEIASLDYARTQNNLGNAYSELSTEGYVANLERAITCYQEALRFFTPDTTPMEYAKIQNNLGAAYYDLPIGNRAANLEHAITCYQEALRFRTPDTIPQEYATTQNNLGNTYSDLPTEDYAANLEQAIVCYQEALRFRTPEKTPLAYARTQNNLGAVYYALPTGDRVANLEHAIDCYQEALRFRTPETDSRGYAKTLNNLGAAYENLPTGGRVENVENAIACYREALRFRTPEKTPLDYASTQNNLGGAYYILPTDRATNLERAIACYQEALRFWTPGEAPLDYARVQHNLGNAYQALSNKVHTANQEQAIACYQEALRFWTPETAPLDYAKIQNSLGKVYAQSTGELIANPERAIACYQEALRFQTLKITPAEYRGTNRDLADLYFAQKSWQDALSAYQAAINGGELLYQAGLSATSKTVEIAENVALYHYAAFAAFHCGQLIDALLLLERGKTRLLTEALHLRVPRPAYIPNSVWESFERAGAAVQASHLFTSDTINEKVNPVQAYRARQQAALRAYTTLQASIEQVRIYAPGFLRELDFATAQTLLPDEHTAIIALCIMEQESLGFVVSRSNQPIQVVEVPTFTLADMDRLFAEWDILSSAIDGSSASVDQKDRKQNAFDNWQKTTTNVLTTLGQQLLTPILSIISPAVKHLILLPSAALFLFPLHAVPLNDEAELLCDRYQVSYAPSLAVLANAQVKVQAHQFITSSLYAVINPQQDPTLAFTAMEGSAIADLFAIRSVEKGRLVTKQDVMDKMAGNSYVHFACHGSYHWSNPLASGLDLSDGRLTLAELQNGSIDLSVVRIVTLSACETGLSDVLLGSAEEFVGLPAGFLLAGAPCVVSSLWHVPDHSTALLMERFYCNHLLRGMNFAMALQEAQAWIRVLSIEDVVQHTEQWYRHAQQRERSELFQLIRHYRYLKKTMPSLRPFEHPYYWAAFTCTGL